MDVNFSTQKNVKYFKYSGIFLRICGLLSRSNRRLTFIAPIMCILILSCTLHFGIFVFLEYNTIELLDIVQYSHLSQLFFLQSTFLALLYINKNDLIDIYLATLKDLYRYPWGNWTYEINIRTSAENEIKLFYSIFPPGVLIAIVQEFTRHATDPSRQPNDSWFKGWVPIPVDSRILTIYQVAVFLTAGLVSLSYFTYIVSSMKRLICEVEVLNSVLRDPHYIAINTNYTIEKILKSCVQHQQIIYKYADMTFNVLKAGLLSAFLNGTLLIGSLGFLLTDNSLPMGIKTAIGILFTTELLTAGCVCYYGQKVYDSNDDLCFSIYQMRWYDLKPCERKIVITIMIGSQRKLLLNGGGIKVFNFQTFSEVLTTAYSYMGMLRIVRQP